MNVQFHHNPGSVGLRSFCADPQNNTDLLGGFPLGNELEHLPLSEAQRLWRQLGFAQIGLNDRLRNSGSQIQLPSRDLLNRLDQLLSRLGFQDVPFNSSAQSFEHVMIFGMHGQKDDFRFASGLQDGSSRINAIQGGHG